LKISPGARRSSPSVDSPGNSPAPSKSHRSAALVVAALILLAAFAVTAPYLSSALRHGFSLLSGSTQTGLVTVTSQSSNTTATGSGSNDCSSEVTSSPLSAPDITNGSANVAYPSNYCTLADYALGQINADRAANGTGPVALDFNRAAQQHVDSMLYYGYFSHWDTQGYKPYMRYTLLGGRAADFENVAYLYYSLPNFLTTGSVEGAIQGLEHSMVYNDSSCCNNGHRDNILDPLRNRVSIGIAYNSTTVFFDEEFENDYATLGFTVSSGSSNPYYVTIHGAPTQSIQTPNSILIFRDDLPSALSPGQLNSSPHEYGVGTFVGGVLPPGGLFGCYKQFSSGTTVCADTWTFTSTSIDISFSMQAFVSSYGPGVYTLYLTSSTGTDAAITSISIFIS
jgi:uncharacterized protein YkwD